MIKTRRHILDVHFNINHRPLMSTNNIFKELNLMKFNEIFEYFMVKFIHLCIYGTNFNIFEEHFTELLPDHKYEYETSSWVAVREGNDEVPFYSLV